MHLLRLKVTAWTLVALTAAVSLVALAAGGGAQTPNTSYIATAYVIGFSGVTVGGKPIPNETLDDSGALPASGGALGATSATLVLPDAMGTLSVTDVSAVGGVGTATATSKVSQVSLLPDLTESEVQTLCLPLLACVPDRLTPGGGPVQLLDISVAASAVSTSATNPGTHTQNTQIGAITLLGGAVKIPLSATPNTTLNLGLLSITSHSQSYNASTNTASAQAVVLHFPTHGALSPAITGTITISSSTVSASLSGTSRTLG